MRSKVSWYEPAISVVMGLSAALLFAPKDYGSADGLMGALLSLAVAGVFPAVVLTASVPRPAGISVAEAYRLGEALKGAGKFLVWHTTLG